MCTECTYEDVDLLETHEDRKSGMKQFLLDSNVNAAQRATLWICPTSNVDSCPPTKESHEITCYLTWLLGSRVPGCVFLHGAWRSDYWQQLVLQAAAPVGNFHQPTYLRRERLTTSVVLVCPPAHLRSPCWPAGLVNVPVLALCWSSLCGPGRLN